MKAAITAATFALALGALPATPAGAWDRGEVNTFATIPPFSPAGPGASCPGGETTCASNIEGIAVGPDGFVYTASFGFNSKGALAGYGQFFVFAPNGRMTADFPVAGSSPHLIGMIYQNPHSVLVADLGNGKVWSVDPLRRQTTEFMQAPTITTGPGLNALAIDKAGKCVRLGFISGCDLEDRPEWGYADRVVRAVQLGAERPAVAHGE